MMGARKPARTMTMNYPGLSAWVRIPAVAKRFPFFDQVRNVGSHETKSGCGSCGGHRGNTVSSTDNRYGVLAQIKLKFISLPENEQKELCRLLGVDQIEVVYHDNIGVQKRRIITAE